MLLFVVNRLFRCYNAAKNYQFANAGEIENHNLMYYVNVYA